MSSRIKKLLIIQSLCISAVLIQSARADLPPFLLDTANVAGGGGWATSANPAYADAFIIIGQPVVGTISNASHTIELGLAPCFNPFLGTTQTIEWVRPAVSGDGLYGDAINWNPMIVPDNNAPGNTLFRAIIPGNLATNFLNISPKLTWLAVEQGAILKINDVSVPNALTTLTFESSGMNAPNGGLIRVEASTANRTLRFENMNAYQGATKGRLQTQGSFAAIALIELQNSSVTGGIIEALGPNDRIELANSSVNESSIEALGQNARIELVDSSVTGGSIDAAGFNTSVLIQDTILTDVMLTGSLECDNAMDDSLLEGLITSDNTTSITILGISGDTSILAPADAGAVLAGQGRIILDNVDGSILGDNNAPGLLINSTTHTIRGQGRILGQLQNNGVFDDGEDRGGVIADVNTTTDPDAALFITGTDSVPIINNGDMIATNQGLLQIERDVTGSGRFLAQDGRISVVGDGSIHGDSLSVTGSGDLFVSDNATATFTGDAVFSSPPCNPFLLGSTPPVKLSGTFNLAGIHFQGQWQILGAIDMILGATTSQTLTGDFVNHFIVNSPLCAVLFNATDSNLTLNGNSPQNFEMAGSDLGPRNPAGFADNFAFGTIHVTGNVVFGDTFNNQTGAGCEVLYVETLNLANGASITLNGCNVYYETFTNTDGTVTLNGDCALMSTNAGDLNQDSFADLADAAVLANVLTGADTQPAHIAAADLNGDGRVDADDIRWLLRVLIDER